MFSNAEIEELAKRAYFCSPSGQEYGWHEASEEWKAHAREVAKAVATRAVELAAARSGAMTAEEIRAAWERDDYAAVRNAFSALGARNAVLEAERNATLVALGGHDDEVPAVRAEAVMERLSSAAESVRELVRRAQQAEALVEHERRNMESWRLIADRMRDRWEEAQARCATISAAGQGEKSAAVQLVELAVEAGLPVRFAPGNYPCSTTCTHDDAAKPGHPERVKERSEAFKSELELEHDHPEAFAAGAEAMRAACLLEIQRVRTKYGISDASPFHEELVAAIEGAVP